MRKAGSSFASAFRLFGEHQRLLPVHRYHIYSQQYLLGSEMIIQQYQDLSSLLGGFSGSLSLVTHIDRIVYRPGLCLDINQKLSERAPEAVASLFSNLCYFAWSSWRALGQQDWLHIVLLNRSSEGLQAPALELMDELSMIQLMRWKVGGLHWRCRISRVWLSAPAKIAVAALQSKSTS